MTACNHHVMQMYEYKGVDVSFLAANWYQIILAVQLHEAQRFSGNF
jgi:hypothetical protein